MIIHQSDDDDDGDNSHEKLHELLLSCRESVCNEELLDFNETFVTCRISLKWPKLNYKITDTFLTIFRCERNSPVDGAQGLLLDVMHDFLQMHIAIHGESLGDIISCAQVAFIA